MSNGAAKQGLRLKKHNHMVPETYLRNFGRDLYSFDKKAKEYIKNGETLSVSNLAVAKGYNTLPLEIFDTIEQRNKFEDLLCVYEGQFANDYQTLIERIDKGFDDIFKDELYERLCLFFCIQYYRSKAVREIFIKYFNVRDYFEFKDSKKQQAWEKLPPEEKDKIRHFLQLALDREDTIYDDLVKMSCVIMRYTPEDENDIDTFYTCDDPAVFLYKDVAMLPISPYLLLFWVYDPKKIEGFKNHSIMNVGLEFLVEANCFIYNNAETYIYTPYKNIVNKVVWEGRDTYRRQRWIGRLYNFFVVPIFKTVLAINDLFDRNSGEPPHKA